MAKIRVHEIAKEYDVTAKEVINFLHGHNIEVTNLSSLEDNAVSLIRGPTPVPKVIMIKSFMPRAAP